MASVVAAPASLQSSSFGICINRSALIAKPVLGRPSSRVQQWAATTSSNSPPEKAKEDDKPEWAKLDSDVPPPWARGEKQVLPDEKFELPFAVYLLASAVVAIATIGSCFEYANKNPLFGVMEPDHPLYTPILGVFAITGFPSTAFLFYKCAKAAKRDTERQDREDGYL